MESISSLTLLHQLKCHTYLYLFILYTIVANDTIILLIFNNYYYIYHTLHTAVTNNFRLELHIW